MRRLSLLLLALLPACAHAQNYLSNPSFEDGLSGWTVVEMWAGVVEPSSTAHDGAAGLLLTTPPVQMAAAQVYQDVTLKRGLRYCISAWTMPLATGGGYQVSVQTGAGAAVDLWLYGPGGAWGWSQACWVEPSGGATKATVARVSVTSRAGLVAGGGYLDSLALAEVAQ